MFVLTFHGIGEPDQHVSSDEREVWISHSQFVDILDMVAARRDVEVTFDDGNKSDVALALPALIERNLKGKFFVCAGRLAHSHYLTQSAVRELVRAGMMIGSHGMNHVGWSKLSPAELHYEVFDSKRVLEDAAEAHIDEAACPYGAYDRRSLKALRDAGFRRVYTSDGGRAARNDFLTARNTVLRTDDASTIESLFSSRQTVPFVKQAKRWIKQFR